jgi:hypothetical protein
MPVPVVVVSPAFLLPFPPLSRCVPVALFVPVVAGRDPDVVLVRRAVPVADLPDILMAIDRKSVV